MSAVAFVLKALTTGWISFFWSKGVHRSGHLLLTLSFLLFYLSLNTLPFGYIDVVSGNYRETGTLLILLVIFYLQTMTSQKLERSRVNMVMDIVLPLTLMSALVRYGTFNLAEITSRQANLSSLGIPRVGLVYDPVNAILFYWLCFIKYKNIQLKKHMNGLLPYQLSSEFHLNTALLLGLFYFLGGIPAIGVFNMDSIYNDILQTIGAGAYLIIYLFVAKKVMSLFSKVFFPLSEEIIEKAIWTRFVPTSIVAFIVSMGIFVVTGGRF